MKSQKKIDWNKSWDITKKILTQSKISGKSVLNGAIGNHLERFDFLAQGMGFFVNGQAVPITKEELQKRTFNSRICILIHGLVSDETMWKIPKTDSDYGSLLKEDLGIEPFYLRYNSGRHISDNGKEFDELLSFLVKQLPKECKEIDLIGHSMGGLVIRSACYYGKKRKSKWIDKVKNVIFIGSPHHGAPLEKLGNTVSTVLGKIPNPFTYLTKKAINLRSDGIKDLRYGFLVEEDWKGKDLDQYIRFEKTHVPLLPKVKYYVITGTLMEDTSHWLSELFGDAIVGKWSGRGKSADEKDELLIPKENFREFGGITHIQLMHDLKVYDQIKIWLQ
ncbi:hypothetical protein LPTSP4_14050 [Leptospira ryugenii]|uniref:GPI inositol-deacylase PGAP1-like alpha/beta domain-containing protein n=1 Tax=Leptospira ryugenii TaxID=1917863 RepID=A0A2P2DZ37_9LEPT|nr:alpha/beta hydrolase [Leptospira ryugenii]GBF49885.1 hypothetical protein LPTSP4_14050 [Leptospira ryugenii]